MALQRCDHPYRHWTFTDPAGDQEGHPADRLLVVPERGGLITGWRCNGQERLYLDLERFRDPSLSVRGGIPVLFPICGGLPGDRLPLPQGTFPIAQHGFARDLPWQLAPLTDGCGVELSLSDSAATRPHYPFAFRLSLAARLEPSALALELTVLNRGDAPLPFSLGLHPYFRVSSLEAVRIDGLPAGCIDQTSGAAADTAEQLRRLATGVDLLASTAGPVRLCDPGFGSQLELQATPPLDLAVVWSDPPRPMVCLEPWTAPRQALISGDRRLELAPGASCRLESRYRVSIWPQSSG
ncbi:galactose mutarotase [Synechococcus sp. GFB01]|uniref:aldose epimerase family protein n=1 Tax=Synechococcus sp. GFB01 TaxID=1662190 RepID=UPI00064F079D|nr:galactose mutarotase [Synechococcus sp. GFB01]KMM16894.1 galactose mutarotase [Synechococcus sp. GFB01]